MSDVSCAINLVKALTKVDQQTVTVAIQSFFKTRLKEGVDNKVVGNEAKSLSPRLQAELQDKTRHHDALVEQRRTSKKSLGQTTESDPPSTVLQDFWVAAASCPALAPVKAIVEAEIALLDTAIAIAQAEVVAAQAAFDFIQSSEQIANNQKVNESIELARGLGLQIPDWLTP